MRGMGSELQSELIVLALTYVAVFVAGVAWAAYRALGWVERMRYWAWTERIIDNLPTWVIDVPVKIPRQTQTCDSLCNQSLDGKGDN